MIKMVKAYVGSPSQLIPSKPTDAKSELIAPSLPKSWRQTTAIATLPYNGGNVIDCGK